MGKRTKAALKTAGKKTRITSKQRAARKVNIEVARKAKKSGQKGSSKGAGNKPMKLGSKHVDQLVSKMDFAGEVRVKAGTKQSQAAKVLVKHGLARKASKGFFELTDRGMEYADPPEWA